MIRCKALGVVLLGVGKPVVLCVVDWTGLRNEAFRIWRKALADAAHTTPEHVSLHTVHPHNAPFADVEAQKLIAAAQAPISLDLKYYDECVKKSAEALKAALAEGREVHAHRHRFGRGEGSGVQPPRFGTGRQGEVHPNKRDQEQGSPRRTRKG